MARLCVYIFQSMLCCLGFVFIPTLVNCQVSSGLNMKYVSPVEAYVDSIRQLPLEELFEMLGVPPNNGRGEVYTICWIDDIRDSESILEKPERIEKVKVPTQYTIIKDSVLLTPAYYKVIRVPKRDTLVTETVKVAEAGLQWIKYEKRCPSKYCITVALVHKPAQYKPINKIKLRTCKQVVFIPATYQITERRVLEEAAHIQEVKMPAVYKRVYDSTQVKESQWSPWQEVICCSPNFDSLGNTIKEIKLRLSALGYKIKVIDNILNDETRKQLLKYQKKHGLPQGSLNKVTLKHLGVW